MSALLSFVQPLATAALSRRARPAHTPQRRQRKPAPPRRQGTKECVQRVENEERVESEQYRILATKAGKRGLHLAAARQLRRAVRVDPHNGRAWQDLAKYAARRDGGDRAATRILCAAIRANRDNPYLWQSLAVSVARQRRVASARRFFAAGVAADATHTPLYVAWAALEAGKDGRGVSVARALLSQAIQAARPSSRLFLTWARIERSAGALHRSRVLLSDGLRAHPQNVYLWHALGNAEAEDGHLDRARRCYEIALRIDRRNVVVLDKLARLEATARNPVVARLLFERGVRASPNDARILHSFSAFEFQVCYAFLRTRASTLHATDSL